MLSEICRSIDGGGQEVTVRALIGVSTYPVDGVGSDAILHAADCAMYPAKNAGKTGIPVIASFKMSKPNSLPMSRSGRSGWKYHLIDSRIYSR